MRLIIILFASALIVATGCGGGGGDTGATQVVAASFTESGTVAAPNLVRLRSISHSGDRVTLEVAIGGPTTNTDLYGFAFNLDLSDPTVASYLAGSASIGDALTLSAGQSSSVQAATSGSRVTVGVSKLGGGPGNGSDAAEAVVVRLVFRALKRGTTTVSFSGSVSPQNPSGDPAAIDSTGAIVPSVEFDTVPAQISGT